MMDLVRAWVGWGGWRTRRRRRRADDGWGMCGDVVSAAAGVLFYVLGCCCMTYCECSLHGGLM